MTTDAYTNRSVVLIDDDLTFCKLIEAFANSRGISIDCYESLQAMGSVGKLSNYAVAIVDYDLGSMNGIEIAEYLPVFFDDMPMVLISSQKRQSDVHTPWPSSVKRFVHKDRGADAILDAALSFLPPKRTPIGVQSSLQSQI